MVYKFKCLISDFTRRDDKDIRKSLHDLSQVKRTSSVKPAPMRAQHSIPIQTPQKDGTTAKTVLVKKFNKQMWRPPVGSPEGSDQRPFSPFGGTLPPSKINKKKVHEVFVWGEWRHLVKYSNGIFRFGSKSSLMCWTINQWLNKWFSFGRDFIMTFIHSMRISFYMDFTKPYFFVVPMQLVCDTFTPSTHSCSEMFILIMIYFLKYWYNWLCICICIS